MIYQTACLGISILGQCSYDPASPTQIQFSIGEGISALALLFVLDQLTDVIAKFRLSIRSWCKKTILIICACAIISIFTAAILPIIPGKALPLIGYPIFWELLVGILFITSITIFFIGAKRPAKFNKCNYEKYSRSCYRIIARGNIDELRSLAIEIESSILPIFNSIKNIIHPEMISIYTKHAISILDLWTDKKFCGAIVNGSFETLSKTIRSAKIISKSNGLIKSPGEKLIAELIIQSITSKDSLLNRENEFSGLGNFKNITEEIFADYSFIISDYRPLDA